MTPDDFAMLVGRMDGKLDMLLERHGDMENRLGILERFNAKLIGIVVAVSAIFTAGLELVLKAYDHLRGA